MGTCLGQWGEGMDVFKWECMLGELEHCMGHGGMTEGGALLHLTPLLLRSEHVKLDLPL